MKLRWFMVLIALLAAACGDGTTATTVVAAGPAGDLSGVQMDVHQAPD